MRRLRAPTPAAGRGGRGLGLWLAAFTLVLAGCSPEYNWRELDAADGLARAAFPARMQSETRPLVLANTEVSFTLSVATVKGAMFAVGGAPFPEAVKRDPAQRVAIGQALGEAAYANLGATPPQTLPTDGTPFEVRGGGARADTWLLMRIWVTDDAVVEAMALGSDTTLPADRAREFADQVKPIKR